MLKAIIFLLVSVSAYANCDLAIIKYKSNSQLEYSEDVFKSFEKLGYNPYEVDDAFQAGLTNADYMANLNIKCGANVINPLMTATVTTLTVSKLVGFKYQSFFTQTTAPILTMGTCAVDMVSLIKKMPRCKND